MQELTLNLPEGIDDGSFVERTAVRGIICQDGKYLVILGEQGDCKFPGGGMEQGEFLFGTLTREVLEETGCHVKPDSIREGFLVHEKTNRQSEEVLVMDSYYYFCEVEDIRDSKEAADASGYAIENFYEGEAGTKVCWLPLADMIARNENVKEPSEAPWVVRELLVMRELQKNFLSSNGKDASVWSIIFYFDFAAMGGHNFISNR